jgi:hypothetical protein
VSERERERERESKERVERVRERERERVKEREREREREGERESFIRNWGTYPFLKGVRSENTRNSTREESPHEMEIPAEDLSG